MPDTAEHRADMFRLAQERRAAGKSSWVRKLRLADIFHNEDMTFEQRRDAIAARIRSSAWFKSKDEYDDLPQFVDELADTANVDEFDQVWSAIYDEADFDRVWIETRRRGPG